MENFGATLRAYREHRGWTKKFISTQTKIPVSSLGAWEKGSRVPPEWSQDMLFKTLDQIALPDGGDK